MKRHPVGVQKPGDRNPQQGRAAVRQLPLVEGDGERRLGRGSEHCTAQVVPSRGQRRELDIDRGDDNVDGVIHTQPANVVDEVRAEARLQDAAAFGRHEVEATRPAVHVAGEDLDIRPLQKRAKNRDASGASNTRDENARHVGVPAGARRATPGRFRDRTDRSSASRIISRGSQLALLLEKRDQ